MDFRKHAVLLAVVRHLRQCGCPTDALRIQNACVFLKNRVGDDLPFEFYYDRGNPISYDIEEELDHMIFYDALRFEGSVYIPSSNAQFIDHELTLPEEITSNIKKVCQYIASMTAASDLSRQATVAWIKGHDTASDNIALIDRLQKLKPRTSDKDAEQAIEEISKFLVTA